MKEKILLADDNQYLVEILKTNFELLNYEVFTAENGEDALNRIKENKPDLIVLDIMMPKFNGYQVCRKIKGDKDLQDIVVVMLTAKAASSDKYWGMDCGADVYVTKPFETEELEEIIKKKLGEKRKGMKPHPVTGLPLVDLLKQEKIKRHKEKKEFAVICFSFKDGCLEILESVNGKFWTSDMLTATANSLKEIAKNLEEHDPLLYFSGDNTFLLLINVGREESISIAKKSLARLNNAIANISVEKKPSTKQSNEKMLPVLMMTCNIERFVPKA